MSNCYSTCLNTHSIISLIFGLVGYLYLNAISELGHQLTIVPVTSSSLIQALSRKLLNQKLKFWNLGVNRIIVQFLYFNKVILFSLIKNFQLNSQLVQSQLMNRLQEILEIQKKKSSIIFKMFCSKSKFSINL